MVRDPPPFVGVPTRIGDITAGQLTVQINFVKKGASNLR
jgi:hypothetical protein